MKKHFVIGIILLVFCFNLNAQKSRHGVKMLDLDGWGMYVGPLIQWELNDLTLGGEIKRYRSFGDFIFPSFLLSWSQYANYRRVINRNDNLGPNNVVGLGMHVSFFSLETNVSFGNNQTLWDFTPKLIFDIGSVNLSYGYKIPVVERNGLINNQHVFSIKYGLHFY